MARTTRDTGDDTLAGQLVPMDLAELRALRDEIKPVFAAGSAASAVRVLDSLLRDAAIPARLRTGGAVIVGKTASHEFGKGITTNNYFYGATHNPWNLDHIPGGSSGGAAAAAAALLGPLQIATDGGGSIRLPAAFCGVVGLKPTIGLLSNRGHTGGGNSSFSVPGPITRSVRDAAIAAEALAGFDPAYIYSRPGRVPDLVGGLEAGAEGLRVGTGPDLLQPAPEPAVGTAYEATLRRLEGLGARLVEIRLPNHDAIMRATMGVFAFEGDTLIEILLGDRPRLYSPELLRMAERKPPADTALWVRIQQDRQRIRQDYAMAFETADILVQLFHPMMPHLAEECWAALGHHTLVAEAHWPEVEPALLVEDTVTLPVLTDRQMEAGCRLATEYDVASACVKPYYLKRCAELLAGSTVAASTVIGFGRPLLLSVVDLSKYAAVSVKTPAIAISSA